MNKCPNYSHIVLCPFALTTRNPAPCIGNTNDCSKWRALPRNTIKESKKIKINTRNLDI